MKNLTDWENDLRHRLGSAEEEVPSLGWEKLMERMAASGTSEPLTHSTDTRKKTFALRLLRIAAPLTAAAACVAVSFIFFRNNEENLSKQVAKVSQTASPSVTAPVQTTHPLDTEKKLAESSSVRKLSAQISEATTCAPQQTSLHIDNVNEASVATTAEVPEAAVEVQDKKKADLPENKVSPTSTVQQKVSHTFALAGMNQARSNRTSHTPSVSLYSTAGSNSSTSQAGYLMVAAAEPVLKEESGAAVPNDAVGAVVQSNLNQYADSRVKHKMPVKVGLSLEIPLTSRLSLHTGVDYTRLSSEIISGTSGAFYQTDQTLHYIGVPVGVSYAFLQTRHVTLYGSAGVELQKCVKGVQTTDFNANNAFKATVETTEKIGKSVWQSSANVSAGVQWNIVPSVGIYAEPGVSYYPSDGSSLLTVWRDKPWQFSLQFGLRLSPFNSKK